MCSSGKAAAVLVLMALTLPVAAAFGQSMRDVVIVVNAAGGTADIIDGQSPFEILHSIDIIPDGKRVMPDRDPTQAVVQPVLDGGTGTNFAQDFDVSPDGTVLYVSRGNLADVAAFDIKTGAILWRVPVSGFRADHMAISKDGRRLFVSAISENKVDVIDTEQKAVIGSFPTGELAHRTVLSPDGKRVYNASVGLDAVLGEETARYRPQVPGAVLPEPHQLTIADAESLEVVTTHKFEQGVRPFVLTQDEKVMYAQLSWFHGIIEYDLVAGRMLRTVQLPIKEGVTEDDYDFGAPHHGLALSPDGGILCAAARASDYVALVSTETFKPLKIIQVGDGPGDAFNGPDGLTCWVANEHSNDVSVISYATRTEIKKIPVGEAPHHLEAAQVSEAVFSSGN